MGSHVGTGAPPILVYFSGDWDVHWGNGVLTHGHILWMVAKSTWKPWDTIGCWYVVGASSFQSVLGGAKRISSIHSMLGERRRLRNLGEFMSCIFALGIWAQNVQELGKPQVSVFSIDQASLVTHC